MPVASGPTLLLSCDPGPAQQHSEPHFHNYEKGLYPGAEITVRWQKEPKHPELPESKASSSSLYQGAQGCPGPPTRVFTAQVDPQNGK